MCDQCTRSPSSSLSTRIVSLVCAHRLLATPHAIVAHLVASHYCPNCMKLAPRIPELLRVQSSDHATLSQLPHQSPAPPACTAFAASLRTIMYCIDVCSATQYQWIDTAVAIRVRTKTVGKRWRCDSASHLHERLNRREVKIICGLVKQ